MNNETGAITIYLDKEKSTNNNFTLQKDVLTFYDYSVNINANLNDKYANLMEQAKNYFRMQNPNFLASYQKLNKEAIDSVDFKDEYKKDTNLYNFVIKFPKIFLEQIKYVIIRCNNLNLDEILSYLENNDNLFNKKVVISCDLPLNIDTYNALNDKFANFDGLLFQINGNNLPVTLQELDKFFNKTNNIVEKVKRYNLSAFEKAMFIFDIVRSKVYNDAKKSESKFLSRDLIQVVNGDRINCVGYSEYYLYLCQRLGIPCFLASFSNKYNQDDGHTRNIIYLNDQKYNINGCYYVDACWDAKELDCDDISYTNYLHFAKVLQEYKYDEQEFDIIPNHVNPDAAFLDYYKSKIGPKPDYNLNKKITYLNRFSRLLKFNDEFKMIDEISEENLNKLKKYVDLFNQPIDNIKFLRAFLNVRAVENCEYPQEYPYNSKLIYDTIANSKFKNYRDLLLKMNDKELPKQLVKEK